MLTVADRIANQRRARAIAQNKAAPVCYLSLMINAEGNKAQLAIAASADEEIRALRATILALGGEV